MPPLRCLGLFASQGFGDTPWERPHTGIDLVCPAATVVYATQSGTFHRRWGGSAQCAYPVGATGGLGLYGEVDTGNAAVLYGHLEGFAASDGATVVAGEPIGFEGDSGCSTGFHLHYEVDVAGQPANPCAFLPPGYPDLHNAGNTRCWGSAPP